MLTDTWEWDGANWTQVAEDGPPNATNAGMVFDPNRQMIVLFGDWDSDDVWEFNGSQWSVRMVKGPSSRNDLGLTYDTDRGVLVLAGGNIHGAWINDTWELDCSIDCFDAAPAPFIRPGSTSPFPTNRYLSFDPPAKPAAATGVALRVTLDEMPGAGEYPGMPDFSSRAGSQMWVGDEVTLGATRTGVYKLATDPVFRDWTNLPGNVVHVSDCNIVPGATYRIEAIAESGCGIMTDDDFSPPLLVQTARAWGDVVGANSAQPPNGITNISDVAALVDCFREVSSAPPKSWCDLAPAQPTQGNILSIDIQDVAAAVDAFKGRQYIYSGPSAPDACSP